jgi:hypothetical protein
VKRVRGGGFAVNLPSEERELLRSLPEQLAELLEQDAGDPALRRLFPPAYLDEPGAEAEYQRLMHDEVLASRRAALDTLAGTVEATRLDVEQMSRWLSALNALRLYLGTRLDITEDHAPGEIERDDPAAWAYGLYDYLTFLEGEIVEALAGW